MARLAIDPKDNIIKGAQRICKYLGISSLTTLWRWIELYGLPVVKRPDGVYMTSMTAIDEWIFLSHEVALDRQLDSRVANVGGYDALRRLQHQLMVDEQNYGAPGGFADSKRLNALKAARGVGIAEGRKEPKRPHLDSRVERNIQRGHHPLRGTSSWCLACECLLAECQCNESPGDDDLKLTELSSAMDKAAMDEMKGVKDE